MAAMVSTNTANKRTNTVSNEATDYGLWSLVILNSAVFIFFAFSFFKPQTKRDWRSFGAFSAFLVALFTEMYGFPLTLYFLGAGCRLAIRMWTGFPTTAGICWKCCSGGRALHISGRFIC